ncbi:hypothetical protein [Colwellia sp. E2M01]|uniref:hypothetical protein n=1 Tax=Colwellia sp. E2M01 TaxID=2841561 RepID=UPI001C08E689|nr:hypothetical protein [Colwellia sp. E2M01]MBU2871536.1 hypothetical protein [Colwellia sp. E2M01]
MSNTDQRKRIKIDIKETILKIEGFLKIKDFKQASFSANKLNFLITDLEIIDKKIVSDNMKVIRRTY